MKRVGQKNSKALGKRKFLDLWGKTEGGGAGGEKVEKKNYQKRNLGPNSKKRGGGTSVNQAQLFGRKCGKVGGLKSVGCPPRAGNKTEQGRKKGGKSPRGEIA